ncbi:MAG: hypothetical protein HN915_00945, partial [Candidatus Marinimicrobia bacterium]|nr:hypothetical protein [Candidatus Neomarinimicrobiota bacterium]
MQYPQTTEIQPKAPVQMNSGMNKDNPSEGLVIKGQWTAACARVLTKEARLFITELEKCFGNRRRELLTARVQRQSD